MKKRKIYDRNFKVKAIQLGSEIGVRQATRELGISHSLIHRWQQELLKFGTASFSGHGNSKLSPEQKRFSELKRKLKNEHKELELKIEIFKNASKYISQGRLIIYHFIENNKDKYSVTKMCEVLNVDASTYVKWKNQVITPTQRRTQLLKKEISSIFFEYKELYGSARIAAELQSRGFKITRGQVAIYMRKLGLISKIRRNYNLKSISHHNPYAVPNFLNRKFTVEEPSKVWLSGITRIQTAEGFLFLTIIFDLFDKKITGWSLSEGLAIKETTIPAWEMAVANLEIKKKLIFHSNRAIQYANKVFTCKLNSHKYITQSMSRQGNHSDNAISESFFNSLKSVLKDSNMLVTKKQMRERIFTYLENLP